MKKIKYLMLFVIIFCIFTVANVEATDIVISGNSVFRKSATEVSINFISNTDGTIYYTVDESSSAVVEDLEENAGSITSNETKTIDIPSGLLSSGLQYIHILVKDDLNNYSNILTISMPHDVYYFDDFEAYNIERYPVFFNLRYNGGDENNQKIIDLDGEKVFQGYGTYSKGLDERIEINSLTTGYAVLEADISTKVLPDDSWHFGGIVIGADFNGDDRNILVQVNKTGKTFCASNQNSGIVFNNDTNYHVKIVLDVENGTYDYYVDGIKANTTSINASPSFTQLDWFGIYNGNGTVYYDNMKFYIQSTNPNIHTITKGTEINGTFTVDKDEAVSGETVTVTLSPATDYRVKSVKVNGSGDVVTKVNDTTYTFAMSNVNAIVAVEFELIPVTYTITKGMEINGTFTIDKAEAVSGETVTVTPSPSTYYRVNSVKVNGSGEVVTKVNDTTYTFAMSNVNAIVAVEFELIPVTYTITKGTEINGTFTIDKDEAVSGETVTISNIVPSTSYILKKIKILKASDNSDITTEVGFDNTDKTFTMPAYAVEISVEFEVKYIYTYFPLTSASQQGVATDGEYIYTSYHRESGKFTKYSWDGTFIEDFVISGVSGGIKDLTYDGTYFYGGSGGNTLFKFDFTSKELIATINTEVTVIRHCSYDYDNDGFWVGDWSNLYFINREGEIQSMVAEGISALYSSAYDNESENEPFLWLFTQESNSAKIRKYYIESNILGDIEFDVVDELVKAEVITDQNVNEPDIAGGSFMGEHEGYRFLLVNVQHAPNLVVIYQLEDVRNVRINTPTNGTVTSNKTIAMSGETVTLTITPSRGFRLSDITILDKYNDMPVTLNPDNTFIMPNYNVFITATFSSIPTSTGTSRPRYNVPFSNEENNVDARATISNGTATVDINDEKLNTLLEDTDTKGIISIDVELNKNVDTVKLPINVIENIIESISNGEKEITGLDITLDTGAVKLDEVALSSIAEQSEGSSITIHLEGIDKKDLEEEQRKLISKEDNRIIVEVTIKSGKNTITNYKGGKITISIPYTLKEGEKAEDVKVWHLAEDGSLTLMECTYNEETKLATFVTDHLSVFVVGTKKSEVIPEDTKLPFEDVKESDWYNKEVKYVFEKGIMNGVGDNEFAPNNNITRGMLVTVMYRLSGTNETSKSTFDDVVESAYYSESIAWASKNGIVNGIGKNKFAPDRYITREEMVTMLYRYAKFMKVDVSVGEDTNILSYDDAFEISDWAISAFQWTCGAQIIKGRNESALAPKGTATRAEIATVIMNFCENVK